MTCVYVVDGNGMVSTENATLAFADVKRAHSDKQTNGRALK